MKKNLLVACFVSALTLMASFSFAGSTVALALNVPFEFYAGEQRVPAGEYEFELGSGFQPTAAVMTVRAKNGSGIWLLATRPEAGGSAFANEAAFNRYGDERFLSSVSINGFKAGIKTQKIEQETRARLQKERNTVIVARN